MKTNFKHLGKKGGTPSSPKNAIIETFPNPGVSIVKFKTEECTSLCPVTSQPDFYTVIIEYSPGRVCLESKSLKLYLQSFRSQKAFMEELSSGIHKRLWNELTKRDENKVLDFTEWLTVEIKSVPRGGLALNAITTNKLPEM